MTKTTKKKKEAAATHEGWLTATQHGGVKVEIHTAENGTTDKTPSYNFKSSDHFS